MNSWGYWDEHIRPQDFVDEQWNPAEKAEVLRRMDLAIPVQFWMGYSGCRFCHCLNGTTCHQLGPEWTFPEGLVHYVREHNLRPPPEFVGHVLSIPEDRLNALLLHQENRKEIGEIPTDMETCSNHQAALCGGLPDQCVRKTMSMYGRCILKHDEKQEKFRVEALRAGEHLKSLGLPLPDSYYGPLRRPWRQHE